MNNRARSRQATPISYPKANPIVGCSIPTKWRGNTVMAIDYGSSQPRPAATIRVCFIPDHRWTW